MKDNDFLDILLPKNYYRIFTYWNKVDFKTKLIILFSVLIVLVKFMYQFVYQASRNQTHTTRLVI
jgi:hypothetical protein